LAWCILKQDIQTDTHDSVEDARTVNEINQALALYKKYLEIRKQGNFEKVMEAIYAEGKAYNFRPPSARSDPRTRIPSSDLNY
jgi:PAB-dependent poly(A)-specific ribonuclease subunit 2